jgi:hypothetical protein
LGEFIVPSVTPFARARVALRDDPLWDDVLARADGYG